MFCVIFIVHPKQGKKDTYLELAKFLKPKLEVVEGFIDNERSTSATRDGFILSLSSWRDEKSLIRWRTQGEHHGVQCRGRSEVFDDYHLRIAEVIDDKNDGDSVVLAGSRFDETEVGAEKACLISEYTYPDEAAFNQRSNLQPEPETLGLLGFETFSGITNLLREVVLSEWSEARASGLWKMPNGSGYISRHRRVRVIRDYSMRDRREAPQYYPPMEATISQQKSGVEDNLLVPEAVRS